MKNKEEKKDGKMPQEIYHRVEEKGRQTEFVSLLWKRRIIRERGVSEEYAAKKVEKIRNLIEYMQYGRALIAYNKQNTTLCLQRATLIGYENFFHLHYDRDRVRSTVVFWDEDQQGWRSFRIENFMDWKPMM